VDEFSHRTRWLLLQSLAFVFDTGRAERYPRGPSLVSASISWKRRHSMYRGERSVTTRSSHRTSRRPTSKCALAIWAAALLATTACSASSGAGEQQKVLRLGLFPNMTHAPAIVCLLDKVLESALPPNVRLHTKVFTAGPQAVEAIFAKAVDMVYVGPSPAVNAYLRSRGEALRIVSGATAGGAALVVQQWVQTATDLVGTRVGSPQLGNTQDIALRSWLAHQGLGGDPDSPGPVTVVPQGNAEIFDSFRQGQLAGAWVPEPWASRLIFEANGKVLVNERDLWPGGLFTTTVLAARPSYLEQEPEVARAVLTAHSRCVDLLRKDRESARDRVGAWITSVTGKSLPAPVLERAWSEVTFTVDPLFDSIKLRAEQAKDLGILPQFTDEEIAGILYKDTGTLTKT
jgi:NitT/TauT family transport system substrate-binding protein